VIQDDIVPVAAAFDVRLNDGSHIAADVIVPGPTDLGFRPVGMEPIRVPWAEVMEFRAGARRFQDLTTAQILPSGAGVPIPAREVVPSAESPAGGGTPLGTSALRTMVGTAYTFAIPPGSNQFSARAAVPADASPGARVVYAIYADGRPVHRSVPISAADGPVAIRCPLPAARALTIRVEPAPGGSFSGGMADWVTPLLYQK
jgi:hypothetical protein